MHDGERVGNRPEVGIIFNATCMLTIDRLEHLPFLQHRLLGIMVINDKLEVPLPFMLHSLLGVIMNVVGSTMSWLIINKYH